MRASLVVEFQDLDGIVVLRPVGLLDVTTHAQLRDAIVKHAAEHPEALVVDLDQLVVPRAGALSVFTSVWQRISSWPGVPMLLSAAREPLATTVRTTAVSRFVPTFGSVAAAMASIGETPPRLQARLTLVPQPDQARSARVWTRGILHGWRLPSHSEAGRDFVEDAVLVVSELVENSIQHAGTPRILRVERHSRGLSIAVSDEDPRPPVLMTPEAATSLGGRGLAMVAAVAVAWGHHTHPDSGKVVWAVLALPT